MVSFHKGRFQDVGALDKSLAADKKKQRVYASGIMADLRPSSEGLLIYYVGNNV